MKLLVVSGWRLAPVLAALALGGPGWAEEPAGIRGRIVLLGEAPESEPLPPGRDECCQEAAPVDQRVVVGETGGLANVLVSVEPRRGEPKPPAGAPSADPAVLTNRGCAFSPRVLIARVGQPLVLANADETMHNVNLAFGRNPVVNTVIEPDGRRELRLSRAERRPVGARCNVHTFMQAWVAVRDDPHAAVTDESGRFALPDLPAGTWRLRFWREGEPMVGLEVTSETTDGRGEVLLETPAEGLDLGELTVEAEKLAAGVTERRSQTAR